MPGCGPRSPGTALVLPALGAVMASPAAGLSGWRQAARVSPWPDALGAVGALRLRFDTMAKVALIAAWVAVVGGVALVLLAALGLLHARRAGPQAQSGTPAEISPAPAGR
jgi:hypothetical protein